MAPHLQASSRILIIGYGQFGKHIWDVLNEKAPGLSVSVYDDNHGVVPPEIFASLERLSEFDIVILAVLIGAYEATIMTVVPHMRKDAILVDVASVKGHTSALLKRHASDRFWISTHPMWGPDSYKKTAGDMSRYCLVVTDRKLPMRLYERLKGLVQRLEINVVEMTAEQHDGHLAETLFLTHFIGQSVNFAGFDRTVIDTVSFGYLMSAVESVRNDTGLFLDVYRYNKVACAAVLARFENATHQVRLMIEGVNS